MGLFNFYATEQTGPTKENARKQREEEFLESRNAALSRLKKFEQARNAKKEILSRRTALASNIAKNLGVKAEAKPIIKTETIPELDQSKVNIGRITVFNRKAWNAEKRGIDFGSGNADLGMAASSEPKLSPFNDTQPVRNVWKLGKEE